MVVLLVSIYFLFPKLVGVSDGISKLGDADPLWIAVAIVFLDRLLRDLHRALQGGRRRRRGALHLGRDLRDQHGRRGGDAALLGGGAGGVALTYWALKKAGMKRREAVKRMIAFISLHYAFYPFALIVFGLLLRTGVLSGEHSVELTIIPASARGRPFDPRRGGDADPPPTSKAG